MFENSHVDVSKWKSEFCFTDPIRSKLLPISSCGKYTHIFVHFSFATYLFSVNLILDFHSSPFPFLCPRFLCDIVFMCVLFMCFWSVCQDVQPYDWFGFDCHGWTEKLSTGLKHIWTIDKVFQSIFGPFLNRWWMRFAQKKKAFLIKPLNRKKTVFRSNFCIKRKASIIKVVNKKKFFSGLSFD